MLKSMIEDKRSSAVSGSKARNAVLTDLLLLKIGTRIASVQGHVLTITRHDIEETGCDEILKGVGEAMG